MIVVSFNTNGFLLTTGLLTLTTWMVRFAYHVFSLALRRAVAILQGLISCSNHPTRIGQRLCEDFMIMPLNLRCIIKAAHFRQSMENKTVPVNILLDQATNAQILKNRAKLKPIVEAVILCGRQNIALRGHRDDSRHYDDANNNPGNFQ